VIFAADVRSIAGAGTLDLSGLEHRVAPLSKVEVLAGMHDSNGGLTISLTAV
jgi:hypothetical protein